MIYKSTCFRALALVVFLSSSVFSYSQVSNADVLFSGTFGGATNVDGTTYSIPTGSEAWAGFANEDVSLYPLSFTNGGDVTFTGSTAGTDVEVYFRFEYNPYPDTEPSFSTETVTVSGTTEASYTVDIPSQGGNTFSSFLLYINTIDSPVTLTNVTLTSTDVADPCSEITCTGEEVCVNGECVISGCIDVNADNFNSNATSDDGTCTYSLSVLTVTTTVCDEASSVQLTGPWWGWDPSAGPSASDNGDGTWTFTFDPAPIESMEYLLVVDGVQENLVASNSASEDWSCTPITDYFSYANRQWAFGSGNVSNVYGTCGACEDESTSLTITTTVCDAASSVMMTGPWWGWDPNAGPVALDNGDGTWTFTFDPAPTDNMEYLLVVDGVQENLIQAMVDGGDCAPLTDYFSYANRQWTAGSGDVSNVYGQCGACEVETTSLTITTTVCDAASSVQMTGPWWGWDPNAGPVASDNADGTWTFTFDPAPTDNMEYLLVVDGVQEDLVAAGTASDDWSCTPVTDYWSYANRQWAVGSGDVSNVYGQCGDCVEIVLGCLYLIADNYNSLANDDDGSCIFPINVNDCAADIDGDNVAGTSDLLLLLSGFGVVCE